MKTPKADHRLAQAARLIAAGQEPRGRLARYAVAVRAAARKRYPLLDADEAVRLCIAAKVVDDDPLVPFDLERRGPYRGHGKSIAPLIVGTEHYLEHAAAVKPPIGTLPRLPEGPGSVGWQSATTAVHRERRQLAWIVPTLDLSVLSSVDDVRGTGPTWHVSVARLSARVGLAASAPVEAIPRATDVDMAYVREVMGMQEAEEDNHGLAKFTRSLWLVVDPARRAPCPCKEEEPAEEYPIDGGAGGTYVWREDREHAWSGWLTCADCSSLGIAKSTGNGTPPKVGTCSGCGGAWPGEEVRDGSR